MQQKLNAFILSSHTRISFLMPCSLCFHSAVDVGHLGSVRKNKQKQLSYSQKVKLLKIQNKTNLEKGS